ncbi:hypothetical protein FGO68_gene8850 [Halteria grandinella]|uniref:Transmembrane protein n=1 Tax=Halteria grandinella TaxID=5974 RepID=A0A8J8P8S6_HALGN|nr:hypothetical protein FGO68_gene8850 [Halteria grandinella]
MNSLVALPLATGDYQPLPYTLTFLNSSFHRFSGCGSIISNQQVLDFALYPSTARDQWSNYSQYAYQRQKAANKYLSLRYQAKQPWIQYDGFVSSITRYQEEAFERIITIKGCNFSDMNYLKQSHLEGEPTRLSLQFPRVSNESMRDQGFVLNIADRMNLTYFSIEGNTFSDTHMSYPCIQDLNDTKAGYEHLQNSLGKFEYYVQMNHMISIYYVSYSLVIINDNLFKNLSMSGPVIHLEDMYGKYHTPFVIARNIFTIIHSYLNSNAITIMREFSPDYDNYNMVDCTPDWVGCFLSIWDSNSPKIYSNGLAGTILVLNNTFSQICGCPQVDASVLLVATRQVRESYDEPLGVERSHSDYLGHWYVGAYFAPSYYEEENLYFVDRRIEHLALGSLSFHKMAANISGNVYTNISMGVERVRSALTYKGTLLSFMNLGQAQVNFETYNNIGAFTVANSNRILNMIRNVKSSSLEYAPSDTGYEPWITQFKSNTLIFFQSGAIFILGQGNNFDNIWLFDRYQALSSGQMKQGILLYVEVLGHKLRIGNKNGAPNVVRNILGFLNDKNLNEGYFLYQVDQSIGQNIVYYGAGAPLFQLINEENIYKEVEITNLLIENVYFAGDLDSQYNSNSRLAALFSTDLALYQQQQFILQSCIIDGIIVRNAQFDGTPKYMDIHAIYVSLNNITFDGIARNSYPGAHPNIKAIVDAQRVIRNQNAINALIKVYVYNDDEVILKQASITNLAFSNVDAINGALPLFDFDVTHITKANVNCTINLSQITLTTSAQPTNLNQSMIPAAALFRVSSQKSVNLHINLKEIYTQKILSKYGLFAISNSIPSVTISDSQFIDMRGVLANIQYSPPSSLKCLNLTNVTIVGNKLASYDTLNLIKLNEVGIKGFAQPSLFKLIQIDLFICTECLISDHHFARLGGFIDLSQKSNLVIVNSKINDLSSYQAGAISINGESSLIIRNSIIQRLKAISQGVFEVNVESYVQIEKSKFLNCQAIQNGIFRIAGDSYFTIQASEFLLNQAQFKNSIGQIILLGKSSSISNCIFDQNQAFFSETASSAFQLGKLIEFMSLYETLIIQNSQFFDNLALQSTSNLYFFDATDVVMSRNQFGNKITQTQNCESSVIGNFIQAIGSTKLKITKSSFSNGCAGNGGAIYIQGEAQVKIANCQFSRNRAIKQGGAIFADSFQLIDISDSSEFTDNQGIMYGGDALYIYNSQNGHVKISDVVIKTLGGVSNFIFISDLKSLSIKRVTSSIENKYRSFSTKSSGFYFKNIQSLNISQSTFKNLQGQGTSSDGGGGMIVEYTEDIQTDPVLISDSIFANCSSLSNGGALTLIDAKNSIIERTLFERNTAELSGGALFYGCNSTLELAFPCSLNISDSQFTHNLAGQEGGAIKWNYYEPQLINVKFDSNLAKIYGNDIASVAQKLVQINSDQMDSIRYVDIDNQSKRILVNKINTVSSGGSASFYFGLIDKYGKFLKSDSKSKLFISQHLKTIQSLFRTVKLDHVTLAYTPVIETDTQFTADKGFFNISKLVLVAEPNTTQKLSIATDGIDINIPDNWKSSVEIVLEVKVSECQVGEQMLSNGKCKECEEGYYLIEKPNEPGLCKTCKSDVSVCKGGSQIYPLPGYWRSTNETDNFIQCLNPESCIGYRQGLYEVQIESCAEGYQGVLCASCEMGYSLNQGNRKCLKCPSKTANGFILAAFIGVIITFVVILVRSNLKNSGKEKNYLPVFFRILVNHFQIITLVGSFDFNWPEEFVSFFKGIQPISEAQSQIVSIDCYIDTHDANESGAKPYYFKSIFLSVLPVALIVASIFVWTLINNLNYFFNMRKEPQLTPQDNKEKKKGSLQAVDESQIINSECEDYGPEDTPGGNITKRGAIKVSISGEIISTIIVILFLVHPTITREMFNIFNCKTIEGINRLYIDLDVVCYQGMHSVASLGIALPSIIIYSAGIPLIGLFVIFKNRYQLQRTIGNFFISIFNDCYQCDRDTDFFTMAIDRAMQAIGKFSLFIERWPQSSFRYSQFKMAKQSKPSFLLYSLHQ